MLDNALIANWHCRRQRRQPVPHVLGMLGIIIIIVETGLGSGFGFRLRHVLSILCWFCHMGATWPKTASIFLSDSFLYAKHDSRIDRCGFFAPERAAIERGLGNHLAGVPGSLRSVRCHGAGLMADGCSQTGIATGRGAEAGGRGARGAGRLSPSFGSCIKTQRQNKTTQKRKSFGLVVKIMKSP